MSILDIDPIADMGLLAEGLGPKDVGAYWDSVTNCLREFANPGDALVCVHVAIDRRATCNFCEEPVGHATFLLRNEAKGRQATSCARCIYYLPAAARRMDGAITIIYMAQGSAAIVRHRYPWDGPADEPWLQADAEADETSEGELDFYEDSQRYSMDELSCEGLGADEIDWDSHDYEWDVPF